ncbi:MAG TPA: WD40 repeat domain-containing protein [Gemmataceae bacterium]|nr:WD40 repeat domain-containing protein [Gemmataceae bacterium]
MLVLKTQRRALAALAFAPDGRGLVAGGGAGVFWWSDLTANPVPRHVEIDAVWSVGVTAGGNCVVASAQDGGVRVIGLTKPATRTILRGVRGIQAAVSPAGPLIVTCPPLGQGPLTAWRVKAGLNPTPVWSADNETALSHLMFTADGSWLVHGDYWWWTKKRRWASWVVVRDSATGGVVRSTEVADTEAWSRAAVSPDGKRLVILPTNRGQFVVLWLGEGAPAPRRVARESTKDFTDVAFHPSGRLLAVTSNDGTVKLFDTARWKVTETFEWGIGKPRRVAFSPDGSLAALATDTGQVVVWDLDL